MWQQQQQQQAVNVEMDEKETAESDSPATDSPPLTAAGVVLPEIMNAGVTTAAAAAGVVVGGESTVARKKRGRPRKYDSEGNLNPSYVRSPPQPQTTSHPGFTLSTPTPPSHEYTFGPKRGRGRGKPSGADSWPAVANLGELLANSAGGDFTPHVVTVYTGEDVAGKILTFAQKDSRGVCVLSANGTVSNVTIRQPGSSGGLLTYEGRFEILSLMGSYTVSDDGGIKSRTGGLSVTLASPDGRVIGGCLAGMLMAASPIQIVIGSFVPNVSKMPKRKQPNVHGTSPSFQFAPDTVTAARPISQAAPESNIYPMATTSQLPLQSNPEADKYHPNSASTDDTSDWNSSGPSFDQRPYPDINISIPIEEQ